MATPADQHDTLALTRPGYGHPEAGGAPPFGAHDWSGHSPDHYTIGSIPPPAWGNVTPFVTPTAAVVRHNNAAVVGATLGSVSLFLALIPLVGIVAWVLAPIGLVTSLVGLAVGVTRQAGRVGATFGLVTSSLALLVCVAWVALLFAL